MALNKEDLQAIADLMDMKLYPIQQDIGELKTDVAGLKTDVSDLKTDVAGLKTDVAEIKDTVNRNYSATLEFYGRQMEFNTEFSDRLERLEVRQEVFENQTLQNMIDIRRIKFLPS